MTTLREQATSAAQDDRARTKAQRIAEREKQLAAFRERWDEPFNAWASFDPRPDFPADVAFGTATVDGIRRTETLHGITFSIDGIPFIYTRDEGISVIATCPDCGAERACHFYGPANLGKLLAAGRDYRHKCLAPVARGLAYDIGCAARDANVTPDEIVDAALSETERILKGWRP